MDASKVSILTQASNEAVHFVAAEALPAIRGLHGVQRFEIRGEVASEADLFDAMAAAMEFPDHFDHQWTAVHDALRDLEPSPAARGFVLLVHNAEQLWRVAPRVAGELIEAWLFVHAWWQDDGVPFHLVFVW